MSAAATTAIIIGASANNAAENAQRTAECNNILANFHNPQTATLTEKREYASCVFHNYGSGEPLSTSIVLFIKIAIIMCFVGTIVGGYKGWKEPNRDWTDVFMLGVIGLTGTVLAIAVFVGMVLAVGFIFS